MSKNFLRQEFIGLKAKVIASKDPSIEGIEGIIIDETKNMLIIETSKGIKKIAKETGGQYFRATGNAKLRTIFKEIDKMEKSKIDIQEFRKKYEMFLPFALIAFGLFVLEIVLRYMVFKRIP